MGEDGDRWLMEWSRRPYGKPSQIVETVQHRLPDSAPAEADCAAASALQAWPSPVINTLLKGHRYSSRWGVAAG